MQLGGKTSVREKIEKKWRQQHRLGDDNTGGEEVLCLIINTKTRNHGMRA